MRHPILGALPISRETSGREVEPEEVAAGVSGGDAAVAFSCVHACEAPLAAPLLSRAASHPRTPQQSPQCSAQLCLTGTSCCGEGGEAQTITTSLYSWGLLRPSMKCRISGVTQAEKQWIFCCKVEGRVGRGESGGPIGMGDWRLET